MADYWKSNPRKYCEVCKCWFGDNKISVDFHESGRRHQENVKKQLRQARAKHVENEKEQQKTAKTLAAIEQAAIQAYEKDLAVAYGEGTVQEASRAKIAQQVNSQLPQQTTQEVGSTALYQQQQQQEQEDIKQKIQENIEKKLKELKQQKQIAEQQPKWQQFTSPEGYTYYYNSETGVSQWEVPTELNQQQEQQEQQEKEQEQQQQSHTPTTGLKTKKEKGALNKSSTAAGHKRGAEQASVESSNVYHIPKRNSNPYGTWTTVSVAPRDETTDEQTQEEEQEKNEMTSSDDEDEEDDVMQIREKTLGGLNDDEQPSLSTSSEDKATFKAFGFKKRTGNRPQIRQRTSDI